MKFAVATDDGETLRFGHFGDAKRYMIYEYKDGEFVFLTERENPYTDEKLGIEKHDDARKAGLIKDLLQDVDVFVGHSMGRQNRERLRKQGKKMVPLLKKNITIEEALKLSLSKIENP